MRIAILEWICGSPAEQPVAAPLLAEGWAMMDCLRTGLLAAGHEVVVPLNQAALDYDDSAESPSRAAVVKVTPSDDLEETWGAIVASCDQAILIAPETERVLEQVTDRLLQKHAPDKFANCHGEFLVNTCDKLQTANCLERAQVAHPATCTLAELTADWLELQATKFKNDYWVIKPRWGAGCEETYLTRVPREFEFNATLQDKPDNQSSSELSERWRTEFIVQPYVGKESLSRSAIVDQQGTWHWLPLMKQDVRVSENHRLRRDDRMGIGRLTYRGGEAAHLPASTIFHLDEVLAQVSTSFGETARGWVGVDLVHNPGSSQWYVVEVNPRCTSSILGLSKSYHGNLAEDLLRSASRGLQLSALPWRPIRFQIG